MTQSGVTVALGALMKAWGRGDAYGELWVLFKPKGKPEGLLDMVEAAVVTANDEAERAGWGDDASAESVSPSIGGVAIYLSRTGEEVAVTSWLNSLAETLTASGLSGTLTAAPQAYYPDWVSWDGPFPRNLSALVAYTTVDRTPLADATRRAGWNVPDDITHRIAREAIQWAALPGSTTYFKQNLHQIRLASDSGLTEPLVASIRRFAGGSIANLTNTPPALRSATFSENGSAGYQVIDQDQTWLQRVQKLTQIIAALAEVTDQAFIAVGPPGKVTWTRAGSTHPQPPYVSPAHSYTSRHLQAEFVLDAHGVQLLTDQHLDHAHDLSGWNITDLGAGRHLVQARNLRAWYATDEPDPSVLAQARADFGDMILTEQTIANHPPPWAPKP